MEITKLIDLPLCNWVRCFDGHFNIGCVEKAKERANGNFKGEEAKWEFIYCPYCGRKIKIIQEYQSRSK